MEVTVVVVKRNIDFVDISVKQRLSIKHISSWHFLVFLGHMTTCWMCLQSF